MDYGPETYGERVADVYDTWYKKLDSPGEVELLEELAAGGPVLELGIGTGRVALPLAARGTKVHGLDASPAIVEQMRKKPGGEGIAVTIGDMADVPVDGSFSLVFVVFNTLFMLTTQDAQLRCFRNVAAHLQPGGRFLVHAFVPDLSRVERGENISVREAGLDHVRIDTSTFERNAQIINSTQVRMTEQGSRFVHAQLRYAFPPELDLMAQLAGLTLENRWATFDKQPFTDESAFAVSVYRA
ncbi:MAG TPA: class I SAM-dependent methyltransferase [Acidimicrobiia bacterium]|jgi:SAM-dependent methyltransferase|nr:class I SAM-dependent methyltransferase [Acidimicrobiia bacterium]